MQDKRNAAPDTARITFAIYALDVIIVVGRYLPLIVAAFVAVNAALATYDFMDGNIGWGVVNAILGFGGAVLLAQLLRRRRVRSRRADLESL
jgi:membrane associated rhomboid family serine protease